MTRAPWTIAAWWIVLLLVAAICGLFYVFNRRKLVVQRDGTVRQGRMVKSFGSGLHASAQTQKSGATLLTGESPSRSVETLAESPSFFIASEAETIAHCVNDFLGHPRPDGIVEYPRPVA